MSTGQEEIHRAKTFKDILNNSRLNTKITKEEKEFEAKFRVFRG
jgi:hypothetical protein